VLTSTNEIKQSGTYDKVGFAFAFFALSVLAFIFLFPLYWMLKAAIQPSFYAIQIPPEFIPTKFTINNFRKLFVKTPALRWFLNSVVVSGASTVLTVFFASLAGYAFAKKKFVGKEVIFWILLTAMMVPKQVMMVPLYILMNNYGLYNTYAGQFLPMVAWPFGLFMMKQFMQGIPNDIIQSAKIDGANEWMIFARIIIPMSLPAVATVGILSFVNTWNDYMWQLVIVKDLVMSTLPVGIAKVSRTELEVDYGLLMAGATFGAVPMFLIFIFFQKYFVKGITMGAVKG
jgi:multiple sugar transport system permease protein